MFRDIGAALVERRWSPVEVRVSVADSPLARPRGGSLPVSKTSENTLVLAAVRRDCPAGRSLPGSGGCPWRLSSWTVPPKSWRLSVETVLQDGPALLLAAVRKDCPAGRSLPGSGGCQRGLSWRTVPPWSWRLSAWTVTVL